MACDTESSINTLTSAEYNFKSYENNDQNLTLRFKDENDETIPLDDVADITFAARVGYKGRMVAKLKCDIDLTTNTFIIPFTQENTNNLAGRRDSRIYKYDIQVTYLDDVTVTYMHGNWEVFPDVPNTNTTTEEGGDSEEEI